MTNKVRLITMCYGRFTHTIFLFVYIFTRPITKWMLHAYESEIVITSVAFLEGFSECWNFAVTTANIRQCTYILYSFRIPNLRYCKAQKYSTTTNYNIIMMMFSSRLFTCSIKLFDLARTRNLWLIFKIKFQSFFYISFYSTKGQVCVNRKHNAYLGYITTRIWTASQSI